MSHASCSLKLSYLVEKLGLKAIYIPENGAENCDDIDLITSEVNRPGLALTGYFTDFEKTVSNLSATPNSVILKAFHLRTEPQRSTRSFPANFPRSLFVRE